MEHQRWFRFDHYLAYSLPIFILLLMAAPSQGRNASAPLTAAASSVDTNYTWREGPNFQVTGVWNAQERAAGSYSPSSWPQGSLATDRALLFAARQVFRNEWNINDIIAAQHPGGGFVQIAESETNYYKGHADYPAHLHINFMWANWSGGANSHFYTAEDGKVKQPLVLFDVGPCGIGNNHPVSGTWWAEVDQACKPVWYQRWMADGSIELKLTDTSPIYTLRARDSTGNLSGADVYQRSQKLYSIDITQYDPINLRMVVKISDYLGGRLVTEGFAGSIDPWNTLTGHTTQEEPLAATSTASTPTPLPVAPPTTIPATSTPQPTPAPPAPTTLTCTKYVATSGSDGAPGTLDQPWRTVAKAASSARAGDTVCFRAGTWNERLVPANSGTASSPITFTAYPGEEHQAILDEGYTTTGTNSWTGIVHIASKSFITVSGLRLINGRCVGVLLSNSNNITILDNQIDYTWGSGVMAEGGSNLIVDGNDLQRVTHMQGGGNPQEQISFFGGIDTFEIKNNRIHNPYIDPTTGQPVSKEGIDAKQGVSNGKIHGNYVNIGHTVGIYIDAYDTYANNLEVFDNESTGNSNGIVVGVEQRGAVDGVKLYNNIIHHNKSYGIRIIGWVNGGWTKNIELINNSFYANGGYGIEVNNDELENVVVRNNISLGHTSKNFVVNASTPSLQVTADHNLLSGDASFVDPTNGDFHLQPDSPAIDAGSYLLAPAFDRDGVGRPVGNGFDEGAYEAGTMP